jgi:hypothetical protein
VKTSVGKVLMLAILIVMVTGLASSLVSCKGLFATSEDGKPMVIYGTLPEPKEPAPPQEMPPPKQEKKR